MSYCFTLLNCSMCFPVQRGNEKQLFYWMIGVLVLVSGLYGITIKKPEKYYSLDIGECSLEISPNSLITINNDNDMTVSSIVTNDIYKIHWRENALDYIKNDLSQYKYNLITVKNLKIIEVNKMNLKMIVGRKFYISTPKISINLQKRIIDKCNYTWKNNVNEIDLEMLINVFHINDKEVKILEKINTKEKGSDPK